MIWCLFFFYAYKYRHAIHLWGILIWIPMLWVAVCCASTGALWIPGVREEHSPSKQHFPTRMTAWHLELRSEAVILRAEGCLDEAVKDDWNWDSIRFRSKLALGENSKVWRLRYSGCWWRMERVFRACRMIPSSRLSNICMIGLWLSKAWLTLSSTKLEWR